MNITWNLWTYKDDSDAAVVCVESLIAKLSPYIKAIIVWDDMQNPIREDARESLVKLGCIVKGTDFNRNGNLLGISSFRGMSQCYKKAVRMTGCEHIAKVDSDALIVNGDLSKYIQRQPATFCVASENAPYGNPYMMHKDVVPFLVSESSKTDPFLGRKWPLSYARWPFIEDRAFFLCSAMYFGLEKVKQYQLGEFCSLWTFNRTAKRMLQDGFKNNIAINFGERSLLETIYPNGDARLQMANEMRRVFSYKSRA